MFIKREQDQGCRLEEISLPATVPELHPRAVSKVTVSWSSNTANATLRALGSPVAQHVIFTASKQVSHRGPNISTHFIHESERSNVSHYCYQVKIPGSDTVSVYSNWMRHSNRTSPTHGVIPKYVFLFHPFTSQ